MAGLGLTLEQYLMNKMGMDTPDNDQVKVTMDNAIQVPVVRYALSKVTSVIAQVPFQIMENTDAGRVPAKKHKWYYTTKEEPNRFTHKFDFMEFLLSEAIMLGDGRAVIDFRAKELLPLYFQHTVTVWAGGEKYHVTKLDPNDPVWRFHSDHDHAQQPNTVVFSDDEVIHIKGLSSNGFTGTGVLDCKVTISIAMASEKTVGKQLNKGFAGTIMLEAPTGVFRTREEAEQFLEDFTKRHTGPESAGKPGMLREGMKANIVTMTNVDQQMIDQRRFNREDVALLFGLETIMGEDKSISYNSAEQKNQQEVRNCFMRWCKKLTQEFGKKLISESDRRNERYCFDFDFSDYLKPDSASLATMLISLRNAMIITANEAREELGYNKIEGGDELVNPATLSNQNDPEKTESDKNDSEDPEETDAETPKAPSKVVENVLRSLMRREARNACSGASKTDFLGWIESNYATWEPKLADKLEELGIDRNLATIHCEQSREQLLTCAECQPEQLLDNVTQCVSSWENRIFSLIHSEVTV